MNRPGDAQVKAGEARPLQGISPQSARAIRKRVAVAIGVRPCEDIKATTGLRREQRAELEVTQHADSGRDLADKSQGEPVGHALSRNGALRTEFGVFRQVR